VYFRTDLGGTLESSVNADVRPRGYLTDAEVGRLVNATAKSGGTAISTPH
jgi:hypothetical protein